MKYNKWLSFPQEEIEVAIASNALIFLLAGIELTSAALAVILHNLAINPSVQEKLYEEIKEAFDENGGDENLGYGKAQSLPYLEMCILEGLRMWPTGNSERLCVKDYKIPGTDLTIEKGVLVRVPSTEFMMDSKYFDDPEQFRPENFSADAKAKRSPFIFQPFGHGPRNCIGMRFALLLMKICLIKLIGNYKLVLAMENKPLVVQMSNFSHLPKGGVWLKVERRE